MMKSRSSHRGRPDHKTAAAKAKADRGRWVWAATYPTTYSAANAARRVPLAEHIPSYEPAGAYEAYAVMVEDGTSLWVRYVAGDEPVPPLPETMTVSVCDRGPGREYTGVQIVTVTISSLCPRCGGPRGVDTVTAHHFHEDGDWYLVDRWTNACGHVDMYAAVLSEARGVPGWRRQLGGGSADV